MARLVYLTTVASTPRLLLTGQLAYMGAHGFDVHVICSPSDELQVVAEREDVTVHGVTMHRDPSPREDAVSLVKLIRLFRTLRPDIVNASTPKAALLGMIAAKLTRVPVRIYLLRGLRLETATGTLRTILAQTERLTSRLSHRTVAVSRSLRDVYIDAGYGRAQKCIVLGHGSSNGVRYGLTPATRKASTALRDSLSIPAAAPVIGFAGRMVADKGIGPLLDAMPLVWDTHPSAHLVLVGGDLAGDKLEPRFRDRILQHHQIHTLPRMDGLASFYGMLDVLAFPSYREGFPNVPLEAAACEVPTVGFRSTGVVDAIQHGITGFIVDRDAGALAEALIEYLSDPALREAHGVAARARVLQDFNPELVWGHWLALYQELLSDKS